MTRPADDGRRRWKAPALVVAVLVVAALAAILLPRLDAHSAPRTGAPKPIHVSLPMPRTITRDGTIYAIGETAPMGAAREPASRNAVRLFVHDEYDASQPLCNAISPSARVVREDDRSVTIASFDYSRRTHGSGTTSCVYEVVGNSPVKHYSSIVVHLARPLGSRTLIDARTGEPIGMISMAERPHPGYLPAGFVQSINESFGDSEELLAWGQYNRGSDAIEIRFRSRTAWDLNGQIIGHAAVHGAAATITDESYERCVSWSDPPGLVREVCSLTKHGFLPDRELLKVANSLQY